MAVYTDVAADELAEFLDRLRHRRTAVLQGHRRGRRELQLPAAHQQGRLHPHALREARGAGRPAVLPRPDGASGRRAASPARSRCKNRDGEALQRAGRPAGRDHHFPRRHVAAPAERRALRRRSARRWRSMHLAGARFSADARTTRCRSPAGGRCSITAAARADERAAGPRATHRRASSTISKRTGRAICRTASSTPICFPTTCSSSATSCRA